VSRAIEPPWRSADPEPGRAAVPDWAITFADIMSLLLAFFVLIVSMSRTDVERYRAMSASLRSAFGGSAVDSVRDLPPPPETPEAAEARRIERQLADWADDGVLPAGASVVTVRDGQRLRFAEQFMFESGRADLLGAAEATLDHLAPVFARYPGRIWVEGHTDDLPIHNEVYPSNWELSAARAAAVVRSLRARASIPEEKMAAVGYADTRPLTRDADPASRIRNRRVEIFLQRP